MGRSFARFVFTIFAAGVLAAPLFAASPRLSIILPRGVQRGAEHEVTFSGSNLGDAQEIFFYEPGFEVTKLEPNGNQVKATIKVAPDCRLGEHVAQVRTASGISDYRTLYVGALPTVSETEPNNDFDAPQAISLNQTVDGTVQNEDVDYFMVEAKKGQRICAEVEGMRLGGTLFDPYVAILDSKRFELSANDDAPLLIQDCVASIVAPEDGKYIIEVRESGYGGDGNCRYRVHIGTFPRPLAVYPAGGKMGEQMDVRLLGDPTGELTQTIVVPGQPNEDFGIFASDAGGISPSPNPFRIFEHGNAFEAEPNDQFPEATAVELPLAFNGIIEREGDVDCFKFQAKKGQVFEVECYARRIRSALDPVLNIYRANGGGIGGNDDSRGPDSYLRFAVPDDGEYIVRVTDHLQRGGPNFVYRVEFQSIVPSLTLGIPRVERYGQYRQQIYVARGNRFGTLINASRQNFGGELVLEGNDLPAGVTMISPTVAANLSQIPVVFEATADASLSGKLIEFAAHHADPNQNVRGHFTNRADFVVSSPGQSLYRYRDVEKLAIAVVDELPFRIEIVEPKVPLVRNGAMNLKIVAHKKEGWDEQINVQFPFRPPGVSATSSVNIEKGKTEIFYPLNANGGAEIKKWQVFALASANVNGAAWASSQMANLEVADQFVTFTPQRASCEQGKPAQIYCKLNHATPFEGTAKVELLGLPVKTTTPPLEFTKDTQELTFSITTDPASPVGSHKNLICQVTIVQNGEPIVSTAGVTELQIDQPLPVETAPPKPEPTPQPQVAEKKEEPKPAPVVEKPLSRLEKLRLAAKKRQEEKAKAAEGGE